MTGYALRARRTLAGRLWLVDSYGLTPYGVLAILIGCALAIVGVMFAAATYGGRSYGRATCARWGAQTGIQTKFVVLNWADSGTCLARTLNGRWVKNSQWVAFVQGSR
jgi:hypothetical protein